VSASAADTADTGPTHKQAPDSRGNKLHFHTAVSKQIST